MVPYASFVGRIADGSQHCGTHDPVPAALDNLRNDVIGLLGEFHTSLANPAVIDRVRVQRLDLGKDRRVVGRLRIQAISPQHVRPLTLACFSNASAIPTP